MGNQVSTQPQVFKTNTVVIGSGATAAMSAVSGLTIVGNLSTTGQILPGVSMQPKSTVASLTASVSINYDLDNQVMLYYTANATSNWTINFRGSSTVPLSSRLPIGGSIKAIFITTNGAVGYYCTGVSVDGVAAQLSWPTGILSAGNAQFTDSYTFNIVRTSLSAFKVFGELKGYSSYYSADYLVVGGGGGGGAGVNTSTDGGGGGAGGYVSGTRLLVPGVIYNFTVGGGGTSGTAGTNSVAFSATSTSSSVLTSYGGGNGTNRFTYTTAPSGNGASGGGNGNNSGSGSTTGGTAVAGQGNAGGNYSGVPGSGGGAGAGGITGGSGGIGLSSIITGTATYYAGGGASAGSNSAGGLGGGAAAGGGGSGGQNGTANTGGGGSGCTSGGNGAGGSGGSGVIIIRVPSAFYTGTVTGGPTVTVDGLFTVIKYTSTGTYQA